MNFADKKRMPIHESKVADLLRNSHIYRSKIVEEIGTYQKELDNMLRKLSKLVDKVSCFACRLLRQIAPFILRVLQALLADLSKVVGQTTLNTTLLNQVSKY
jgi:hypothetical protein